MSDDVAPDEAAPDVGRRGATFFERAPCGLVQLDGDYRIVAANDHFRQLLGRPVDATLLGVRFPSLLTLSSRIYLESTVLLELSLGKPVYEIALDLIGPDRVRVPVLVNASSHTDEDGGREIDIAIMRAAAKRAYEAEVPKARLDAAHARDEAQSANRVKGDFLANISHEIRTPLNGVLGLAGALGLTELKPNQRNMVELIEASGQTLERLVSDILDISKAEAGRLEPVERAFELRPDLGGVLGLMRARAEEKLLSYTVEFGETADGIFYGDNVRLKQVLGNLLSNAVKFAETGGVSVSIDVVDAEPEASRLNVSVRDTGIGFDPRQTDALFDRFHQAEAGISRRFGGTGLGLAISRALVTSMGGEISADSVPGKGSVFAFSIPLARTSVVDATTTEAPANVPPAFEEMDGQVDAPSLRVLLVEDNVVNQKVVNLILDTYGVDLVTTDNGALGLAAFKAGAFDLVLMDMQMPVMDGLTAIREIRSWERGRSAGEHTPIAVLSANAMEHHRQEALAAGADLHIAKPITPTRLLQGMEAAMQAGAPDV